MIKCYSRFERVLLISAVQAGQQLGRFACILICWNTQEGTSQRQALELSPPQERVCDMERQVQQMKTAVIVTGGKQYRVAEGDVLFIEKLDVQAGDTVKFDQVLALLDDEDMVFGTPVVKNAVVTANVVKNGKGKKIRVYKMKPKKGYRRTQGHRQPYTKVQISEIRG